MTDDIDPEVLADLQLRKASECDRTRTQEADNPFDGTTVAVLPCRRCGVPCDVSAEAMLAFETFNKRLASIGEAPLDHEHIMRCKKCNEWNSRKVAEVAEQRRVRNAQLVKELGAERPPHWQREREIIDELRRGGCEDVDGLVRRIAERRDSSKGGKRVVH